MEELIIEAGNIEKIGEGTQRLKRLEIREDATLVFEDTTTLIVNELITHKNSKIKYEASDYNENPSLNLYCIDASGVDELEVIGHGKPGKGYTGLKAARGRNGRNAGNPSFKYPKGRRAKKGGSGANGSNGRNGEDAVDFFLHFPALKPGAEVAIRSIGGKGGDGQSGGNGGRGGHRSVTRDGKNGGPGGNGGNGGHGGDIGKAYVFVVIDDALYADRAKSDQIIESINIEFDTAPGDGGSGGSGGSGGQPGKGAPFPGEKKSGPDGRDGRDGDLGDGPQSDATVETWTSVDILALSAYQQFVAQKLQMP